LQRLLPFGMTVAGNTGTTNELRDSWFAGFSGMHVAVAWVGRDDNKPTGLTGATGALPVWAATMANLATSPLQMQPPAGVNYYYADVSMGKIFSAECGRGQRSLLPFIEDGQLPQVIYCRRQSANTMEKTVNRGLKSILDFLK
ncbi:MAG: penicillin-binding protein 1B, partial [Desulforhopalus sp.]